MNLIRPAGVVAERIDGAVNVKLGLGQRLAVVQSLKVGEVTLLQLDQVGQFVDETAAGAGVQLAPGGAQFEGISSRLNGLVDVGLW